MGAFNHYLKRFVPPKKWLLTVLISCGIISGLMVYMFYMFYISKAYSYVSDKPSICTNCHIMAPQYATWVHSSHRETAVCNDCHVPHNNFMNKYFFKAKDGMRHATIFTLRAEPQVIFIKEAGVKVVQQNCLRCHEKLFMGFKDNIPTDHFFNHKKERLCWECHRETPHGRVNSLSAVPYAMVPLPDSPVPDWMSKLLK
jgi:cytochrome c nitrite reductase small subunit